MTRLTQDDLENVHAFFGLEPPVVTAPPPPPSTRLADPRLLIRAAARRPDATGTPPLSHLSCL